VLCGQSDPSYVKSARSAAKKLELWSGKKVRVVEKKF